VGFVILEGVDGAGKTTLARAIVAEYDAYYRHVGPPEDDSGVFAQHVRDVRRWKQEARLNEISMTVVDRFHLGTWAYGKEFRASPELLGDMDELEWSLLEDILIEVGAHLVLVRPPWAVIEKVWQERNSTREGYNYYEADLDRLRVVYEHFNHAFEYSRLPKTIFDRTKENSWVNLITSITETGTW
jgi:thymidylate kinase